MNYNSAIKITNNLFFFKMHIYENIVYKLKYRFNCPLDIPEYVVKFGSFKIFILKDGNFV